MLARRLVISCYLLFVAGSVTANADTPVEQFARSFDGGEFPGKTLTEIMSVTGTPGMSIAVINDFKIDWTGGFGVADQETGEKVDEDTLFQAASVSKPVTALALLKAVESGLLSLDANVNEVLTSWRIPDSAFTKDAPVTPRALASHTSGLGDGFGFPGYEPEAPLPTLVQILDGEEPSNVGPVFMKRKPYESMQYSGGGYVVLQRLLEDLYGVGLDDLVSESVFRPLAMQDSFFQQPLPKKLQLRAASAHDEKGDRDPAKWHVYPELSAAGLWTTPTDLAKLLLELQLSSQGRSNSVIGQTNTQQMQNPVGVGSWGVGFRAMQHGEGWYFGHSGNNWGFRCFVIAHKIKGHGLAVMTNSEGGMPVVTEALRRVATMYDWDYIR